MNKQLTLTLKDLLFILAIGVLLFLNRCDKSLFEDVTKETVTETKVDIEKVVEQAVNNALLTQRPETKPFIIYQDRVVPVQNIKDVNADDLSKVKDLQVYKDTTELKNAKIYSEIASDGKIYSNKVTAEVDVKTITTEKKVTITKYPSGFFVAGGMNFTPQGSVDNFSVGLDYQYKSDITIGLQGQWNIPLKEPTIGFRIAKKIFK